VEGGGRFLRPVGLLVVTIASGVGG
jgi:hypothetical protein